MIIVTLSIIFSNKQIENSNFFRTFTGYFKIISFLVIIYQRRPMVGASSMPATLRIHGYPFQVDTQ